MRIKDYTDTIRHLTDPFNIPEARRMIQENPALSREQFAEGQLVQPGPGRQGYAGTKEGALKKLKTPATGNWMTKQELFNYLKANDINISRETIGKQFIERYNIPTKLPNPEKGAQGQWHWYKKPDVQQMKDMKLTEMGTYDLEELNKGAKFYGKDKFEDLPTGNNRRSRVSVYENLRRHGGKYVAPTYIKTKAQKEALSKFHTKYYLDSTDKLKNQFNKGKDLDTIAKEYYLKNKNRIDKELIGKIQRGTPIAVVKNAIRNKMKVSDELRPIYNKIKDAEMERTRVGSKGFKEYDEAIKKLLPIAQEKGYLPYKDAKGRAIKNTSRYFQYVRGKQIAPVEKLFGYLERVGVEHPGGIKRAVNLMDVESLKEVIPIASTQNKPKGREIDSIVSRQIKNAQQAHDAQKPGMVKRYLATANRWLDKGKEQYGVPASKYYYKDGKIQRRPLNISLEDPPFKAAKTFINNYIKRGGEKLESFKKLMPELQASIQKYSVGDNVMGSRFLKKALSKTGVAGLAGLVTYGALSPGSAEAADVEKTVVEGFSTSQKLGAAAGVGTAVAARKPIMKGLGKIFRTAGTPLAGPAFAAWNVSDKMKEGESLADAIIDPLTGAELALPGMFKENLAKITKNPRLMKLLSLGYKIPKTAMTVGRLTTPVGWGIAGLGALQDSYKDYQRRKEFLTPERKRRAQREYFDKDEPMFAEGGIASLKK
jgi:hypothetical protein